jgi:arginine exporter protein ArgO
MGLDIRIPIGILFAIFGALLITFGVLGDHTIYAKSLNININLWWGIVMLLFGGAMLLLSGYSGRRQRKSDEKNESSTAKATAR